MGTSISRSTGRTGDSPPVGGSEGGAPVDGGALPKPAWVGGGDDGLVGDAGAVGAVGAAGGTGALGVVGGAP